MSAALHLLILLLQCYLASRSRLHARLRGAPSASSCQLLARVSYQRVRVPLQTLRVLVVRPYTWPAICDLIRYKAEESKGDLAARGLVGWWIGVVSRSRSGTLLYFPFPRGKSGIGCD
ncbi:hypothetical protein B0H67DRAFT_562740 [Lasiosphaeris hirsuta]|uniref:Secreted protein n=1 Tax=Lasiosphaeris hirsuta TaxID=260670 RepID=A0AA40E752_9PEZI|nr:hypothetical protein B0H67DRAFT_562740 [Lasiosphaeris hirsuta]